MKIIETEKFFNAGYGWVCKRCAKRHETDKAEKTGGQFKPALAKWQELSRRNLYCPRCGAAEEIDKS